MSSAQAAQWVTAILGCYVCVSSSELLSRRTALAVGGLLSADVLMLNQRHFSGTRSRALQQLVAYPNVLAIIGARLLAGALLLASLWIPLRIVSVATISVAITSLLLAARHVYGGDGADQMALITIVALALGYLGASPKAMHYSLQFIAFQVQLAYLTAGFAKLSSKRWRDGTGLAGIISTHSYGRPWASQLLERNRRVSQLLSWSVMLMLLTFVPLVHVGGVCAGLALGTAATFHIGNAVVMRLHTFVWSFIATYPALIYVMGR